MPTQNILDLFRLDGKVALVTGAASGLGAAIATALAQAGASVAVHGNRRAADETAAALNTAGHTAAAFQADLSITTGADALFSAAYAHFGHIDILINNAGTIHRDAAVDTTLESWQQVLQVNLTSVFQLSQLFAREMSSLANQLERSSISPACSASREASASPPTRPARAASRS